MSSIMASVEECPSCNTSLRLFTPRESERHVNECLDAGTPVKGERLECAICGKDLSPLTQAARNEHANSCLDSLKPKKRHEQRSSGRTQTKIRSGAGILPQQPPPKLDRKVKSLLDALGLGRYASKFASEEIDLDALRLLTDEDLTALRIPDAARRRIAEAMHSVALLNRIAAADESDGEGLSLELSDTPAPRTQNFQESRIAGGIQRRETNLLNIDSDSDDELYGTAPDLSLSGDQSTEIGVVNIEDRKKRYNVIHPDDAQFCSKSTRENILSVADPYSSGTDDAEDSGIERVTRALKAQESCGSSETKLGGTFGGDNSTKKTVSLNLENETDDECANDWNVSPPPVKIIRLTPKSQEHHTPIESAVMEDDESTGPVFSNSPGTLADLEAWRVEATREEAERHKRRLKAIDSKFRRIKRKVEESEVQKNSKSSFEKGRNLVSSSPIDLTLDDTPVKENNHRVKKASLGLESENASAAPAQEPRITSEHRLENVMSRIFNLPGSLSSSSDDDFSITFSNRVANPLKSQKGGPPKGMGSETGPIKHSEGEVVLESKNRTGFSDVDNEAVISDDEVMDLTQVQPSSPGNFTGRLPSLSSMENLPVHNIHASQSSEELMDLTQKADSFSTQKQFIPSMDDLNTRESCSGNDLSSSGGRLFSSTAPNQNPVLLSQPLPFVPGCASLPVNPSADVEALEKGAGTGPETSRLRESKKVTPDEIRCAIRADPKLLDDILLMKSVDLDRVMSSVKSYGLKVSMNALGCFMFSEGLAYKEAPDPAHKKQSSDYFKALSTKGFF